MKGTRTFVSIILYMEDRLLLYIFHFLYLLVDVFLLFVSHSLVYPHRLTRTSHILHRLLFRSMFLNDVIKRLSYLFLRLLFTTVNVFINTNTKGKEEYPLFILKIYEITTLVICHHPFLKGLWTER